MGIDSLFQAEEPARLVLVRHWHGTAATTATPHLALTELLDGKNVEWMEPVTDG